MDSELAAIDAEIAAFRQRWLLAYDAGHDGECCWFETLIDELLDRRTTLAAPPAA